MLLHAYSSARGRDTTIADNIESVLPRPMSSARIPPFTSSISLLFAPVIECLKLRRHISYLVLVLGKLGTDYQKKPVGEMRGLQSVRDGGRSPVSLLTTKSTASR